MYILDEPSIGLHSKDSRKLITILKKLRDLGNTVIVVEHDEDIIRSADYIIDIGRFAGDFGGEVTFCGELKKLEMANTLTAEYLYKKERKIKKNINPYKGFIEIKRARCNNLKNIDVKIPLNCLVSISGVSGSGKSSLIKNILYPSINRRINGIQEKAKYYKEITGDLNKIEDIKYISQNPIGRSSRSVPITYTKAYDDIRNLYASLKLSKIRKFKPSFFSFNSHNGGRCEECKGDGYINVEMQFMADVKMICEECNGQRFKKEILEVAFEGKNINDILKMSIDEGISFFEKYNQSKISLKLKPLQDVGLGYVSLGQSSSTLSGGEAQRLKLASFLGKGNNKHTLFLFDEPTTGLHFYDIEILLKAFEKLISRGNSIIVIEHNLDIIKNSDYIIDLGKEGGMKGGDLIFQGTPNDLKKCKESYTGSFL